VQLPSSDEYDSWVTGLSLGGETVSDAKAPAQPKASASNGPFGTSSLDSSFDAQPDPFGAPAEAGANSDDPFSDFNFDKVDSSGSGPFAAAGDQFGSGPFGSAAPTEPSDPAMPDSGSFSSGPFGASDPFSASPSLDEDPFASMDFGNTAQKPPQGRSDDIFASVPGTPRRTEPPKIGKGKAKPVTDKLSKTGGSARDPFGGARSDLFGASDSTFPDIEEAAPQRAAPSSGSFAFIDPTAKPSDDAYYSIIPPEIQVDSGSGQQADRKLMMSVGILVVLNVVSLAFVLVNLMSH
jgi:hypothetical protein